MYNTFVRLYERHKYFLEKKQRQEYEKILAEWSEKDKAVIKEQYKYCDKLLEKAYNKYGKFIKQAEYLSGIGEQTHIIILVSFFDIPFKETFIKNIIEYIL